MQGNCRLKQIQPAVLVSINSPELQPETDWHYALRPAITGPKCLTVLLWEKPAILGFFEIWATDEDRSV